MRGLPALTRLNLSYSRALNDAGLLVTPITNSCDGVLTQGLPGLTRLNLSHSRALTDAGLASLRKLTNLRHLALVHCPELTDRTLEHLGRLPLQRLDLSKNAHITNKGVENLQFLTRWGSLLSRLARMVPLTAPAPS